MPVGVGQSISPGLAKGVRWCDTRPAHSALQPNGMDPALRCPAPSSAVPTRQHVNVAAAHHRPLAELAAGQPVVQQLRLAFWKVRHLEVGGPDLTPDVTEKATQAVLQSGVPVVSHHGRMYQSWVGTGWGQCVTC